MLRVPETQRKDANGDEQLAHHLEQSPGNAMYTSKFSLTSLIEAIATWLR